MPARTFSVSELDDLLDDPVLEVEGDHRRWSTSIDYVVRADDGKLYHAVFERGNTEYQDSEWWNARPGPDGSPVVDCPEVEVYDEVVTVKLKRFRKVPQ